ncbi:MAG: hypothetical protein C4547_07550, partial [Phycisphaerales bacterium]
MTIGKTHDDSAMIDRTSRWAIATIALATAAGTGLRFVGLSAHEFWYDESCTYLYVRDLFDWPAGWANLLRESTNLPYYVLLRGWATIFGHSEAAYRAFSALAAALTVPLLGAAAARLAGRRGGVIAAVLAAAHPLHVYYAHEARAYALWVLLLTGAAWALIRAVQRMTARSWSLYGVLLLAALPTHYFSLYWAPATLAAVTLAQDRRRAVRFWAVTHVVVGLCFLPYFFAAVLPAGLGGGNRWLVEAWEPLAAIPNTLWAMLPAGRYPPHLTGLSASGSDAATSWPELAALAGAGALILVAAGRCARALTAVGAARDATRERRRSVARGTAAAAGGAGT